MKAASSAPNDVNTRRVAMSALASRLPNAVCAAATLGVVAMSR